MFSFLASEIVKPYLGAYEGDALLTDSLTTLCYFLGKIDFYNFEYVIISSMFNVEFSELIYIILLRYNLTTDINQYVC